MLCADHRVRYIGSPLGSANTSKNNNIVHIFMIQYTIFMMFFLIFKLNNNNILISTLIKLLQFSNIETKIRMSV